MGRQIAQSELGSPLPERFELVTRLHEHMTDDLAGGGSRFSVQNKISALRRFFAWIDSENVNLSLETAADTFIRWTDHLLQRHRVERNFSDGSLYDLTRLTATMLDRALDRQASLSKSTRIRKPRGKGKVHTSKADKQSLQNTFAFGHLLADVCEALTWRGQWPPPSVYFVTHRPSAGTMVGIAEPRESSGPPYQAAKPSANRSIPGGACRPRCRSDTADPFPHRQFTDRE
ncbi:hypothetical protein V5O39_28970 [Pseudomonas parakoreensis]